MEPWRSGGIFRCFSLARFFSVARGVFDYLCGQIDAFLRIQGAVNNVAPSLNTEIIRNYVDQRDQKSIFTKSTFKLILVRVLTLILTLGWLWAG